MQTARWLLLGCAAVSIGCTSPGRDVMGRMGTSSSAINTVVLAQSSSGKVYASSLSASGTFHLQLPTGERYRLAFAQKTPNGFNLTTSLLWHSSTGQHPWARLAKGAALRLLVSGNVVEMDDGSDDDKGEPDDVTDGETCTSGGDEGGQNGQADGVCHSGGDDGEGDNGQADAGCHSGGDDGESQVQQHEDSMGAASGDVEADGDVKCDDGESGDDDGNSLQCSPDAGTSSGGGAGGGGGGVGGLDSGLQ